MKTNLDYFLDLCKIPHGSGQEEGIADYLTAFAKEYSLRYERDDMHNVIIFKDASPGCENAPAVLLQGHTDMVNAKTEQSTHNFDTDPIPVVFDGDILRADGTTLGADNGVAVGTMLSLLADPDLTHPALECVFTVQEETGLFGAAAIDLSNLRATRMINLDAGPEGHFLISCAGGVRITLHKNITTEPVSGNVYRLDVRGLLGGHSGGLIHTGRANALKVLGQVLDALRESGARLCSLSGGEKENAIPYHATALFAMDSSPEATIASAGTLLRNSYATADPNLSLTIEPAKADAMLSLPDSNAAIDLLCTLPCGVRSMSPTIPGLVETSSNLGVAAIGSDGFSLQMSLRSSQDEQKHYLYREIQLLCQNYGVSLTPSGDYPGWAYEPVSPLRERCASLYKKMYNKEPVLRGIHAGLECGLFKGKMPALDIVAMGPTSGGGHSPDEWLDLPSFTRMREFTAALLAELAQG